eukprot:scaffold3815_cov251-Pinguiococcus_pyrenoidosus.AAC.3
MPLMIARTGVGQRLVRGALAASERNQGDERTNSVSCHGEQRAKRSLHSQIPEMSSAESPPQVSARLRLLSSNTLAFLLHPLFNFCTCRWLRTTQEASLSPSARGLGHCIPSSVESQPMYNGLETARLFPPPGIRAQRLGAAASSKSHAEKHLPAGPRRADSPSLTHNQSSRPDTREKPLTPHTS